MRAVLSVNWADTRRRSIPSSRLSRIRMRWYDRELPGLLAISAMPEHLMH
nr:hypothetical protein [Candidatus Methanocrinis natronophilus]